MMLLISLWFSFLLTADMERDLILRQKLYVYTTETLTKTGRYRPAIPLKKQIFKTGIITLFSGYCSEDDFLGHEQIGRGDSEYPGIHRASNSWVAMKIIDHRRQNEYEV